MEFAPIHEPLPDERLVPEAFLRSLADDRCAFEVARRWFGYDVRRDRWSCAGHMRNCHTLHFVHEGEIALRVNGRRAVLRPGSLLWLSPNVRFDMRWPPVLAFTEMWFSLQRDERLLRLADDAIVRHDAWALLPTLELAETVMAGGGRTVDPQLRHVVAIVLIEATRADEPPPPGGPTLSHAEQAALIRYVREHAADRPGPGDLARVVGLSTDYFTRVFRRSFGVSPRQFLVRERMRLAARMLVQNTRLTVYQVADQLGYASVAQFSRQFAKQIGQSPRDYRQRH